MACTAYAAVSARAGDFEEYEARDNSLRSRLVDVLEDVLHEGSTSPDRWTLRALVLGGSQRALPSNIFARAFLSLHHRRADRDGSRESLC
jgi:hypothetical protein